jgi:predicted HAD superfamily Cof-like phosphohydrolase
MTTEQKQVMEWNQKAGNICPDKPTIPDLETRKICAKLILEEALETISGLGVNVMASDGHGLFDASIIDFFRFEEPHYNADLTEVADGLADLMVVTLGCASRCGIDLEPVFAEVMRANESKWWTSSEVGYSGLPGFTFTVISDGLFAAKDSAGKIRKSPHYKPPEIEPILEAQTQMGIAREGMVKFQNALGELGK